jgi:hypothetical protein
MALTGIYLKKKLKTNPGAQNLKTGADAFGTVEKESGRTKHENWTQRPRYRRKRVWERCLLLKNFKDEAAGQVRININYQ